MSSCICRSLADLLGDLLAALVAGLAGLLTQLFERLALGGRRCRAAPRRCRRRPRRGRSARASSLPLAPQLLQHLAHALQPLAVAVPEARLHHAPQGGVEVAVVEQVVGDLGEDLLGVEVEADLACRPSASTGIGQPWGEATGIICALSCANPYPLVAMRVPRTFVFVDLTGFTNYTADNGDDAAGRLLSRFRAATREVASERGVRVAKWLGDGAMIVCLDRSDCDRHRARPRVPHGRGLRPAGARTPAWPAGYALLLRRRRLHRLGREPRVAPVRCRRSASRCCCPPTRWPICPRAIDRHCRRGTLAPRRSTTPVPVVELQRTTAPSCSRNDTGELWMRRPARRLTARPPRRTPPSRRSTPSRSGRHPP